MQFVEKLRLLSPPGMKSLVENIQEICPKGFTETDGKAQILVDLIDPSSFYTINAKVDELLVTDKTSNKKVKLY